MFSHNLCNKLWLPSQKTFRQVSFQSLISWFSELLPLLLHIPRQYSHCKYYSGHTLLPFALRWLDSWLPMLDYRSVCVKQTGQLILSLPPPKFSPKGSVSKPVSEAPGHGQAEHWPRQGGQWPGTNHQEDQGVSKLNLILSRLALHKILEWKHCPVTTAKG